MIIENDGVDTIVRFHDSRRIDELERAVFSLVGQEYRPLRILLVLQRFSDSDVAAVEQRLAPLLGLPDHPQLTILRYQAPEPHDARSVMVNMGFKAATARYVALLDYDDVLYPEAYRMLVARLRESGAGIAFGGIGVKHVDIYDGFVHIVGAASPFDGSTLADLFRKNFCPIHSFVLDRSRVPLAEMRFDSALTIEEDYEFLLRICATTTADFSLIHSQIGEYYHKSDESNTTARKKNIPADLICRVDNAANFNEMRRRVMYLSSEVQKSLGLNEYDKNLTIRSFLEGVKT